MISFLGKKMYIANICYYFYIVGTITVNKAGRGAEIPAELFHILKDDAVEDFTQYASKFGKLSSGHRTGKGQFSFQSSRKASNAKECSNYCTVALISHASKAMPKFSKLGFNSM